VHHLRCTTYGLFLKVEELRVITKTNCPCFVQAATTPAVAHRLSQPAFGGLTGGPIQALNVVVPAG
jgi:hypothetical protein